VNNAPVLANKAQSVFTIEHPIFMAAAHPRWIGDEEGRRTWPVNSYSVEGERRTDWFVKGVLKYHRTLGTTLNTLIGAGSPSADRGVRPDARADRAAAAIGRRARTPHDADRVRDEMRRRLGRRSEARRGHWPA
jgi:hypothetical protein